MFPSWVSIKRYFYADGDEYIGIMNAPVVFMSGDALGTTICENVTINDDDNVIEPDQTFSVAANSSDPVNISPISKAEVTIIDDDGRTMHLHADFVL